MMFPFKYELPPIDFWAGTVSLLEFIRERRSDVSLFDDRDRLKVEEDLHFCRAGSRQAFF
jgi:hypothetical protein